MPVLSTILIGSGVAYVASKLVKAVKTSNAGDKLTSDIVKVKFKGFTGTLLSGDLRAKFEIQLSHTNPTGTNLKFNFMLLDILIDNTAVAKIREDSLNFDIKPSGVTTQTLNILSENLFIAIPSLIAKYYNQLPKTVKIVGNIKVNNFSTDFNKEIPLINNESVGSYNSNSINGLSGVKNKIYYTPYPTATLDDKTKGLIVADKLNEMSEAKKKKIFPLSPKKYSSNLKNTRADFIKVIGEITYELLFDHKPQGVFHEEMR